MALVPASNYLTQLPDPRGVEVATPVSAGILGGIADSLNHDVGWRQLRGAHWVVERRHDYADGGTYTEDPAGKSIQTFPFIFKPDTRAEYLQVLVTYQARTPTATSPRLQVWLTNLVGASVDGNSVTPAFLWDYDDGTLNAGENYLGPIGAGLSPVSQYFVQHGNTSNTVDDTPSNPTTPRCLNLTTYGGQDLVLWIKEQECRLLTVTVKELYREMIDQ